MISLEAQMAAFLATIAGGFIMGLSFDVYTLLCGKKKSHQLRRGISDLVYWLFVTLIILYLLIFYGNWGEVRVYVYIGVLLGILLYRVFFSFWVKKVLQSAINVIKRILTYVYRFCLRPVILPLKKFGKAFRRSIKGMMG